VCSSDLSTLADVVFHRTGLGSVGVPDGGALRVCAMLMARELSWDKKRIEQEIARVPEQVYTA